MANFIVRVELHKATESDYEVLHASMAQQGFTRTIPGTDGSLFKLPTAEYFLQGIYTVQQVYTKTATAAKTTNKNFWILVSEATTYWFLLDKA